MNKINKLVIACSLLLIFNLNYSQKPGAAIEICFHQPLHEWNGFGVNYVETRHTRDYDVFPQDYGGFKYLREEDRQLVLDMIFGADGLKPAIIKVFADPFHEPENDNNDPYKIDMEKFDHTTTTNWMLYFCREGEKRVKEWNGHLTYLACLYGPPSWMSKQPGFRGRDLDHTKKLELAEYIVSWTKYLKEIEGFDVSYISMHNEGEDARRWAEYGEDDTLHYSHDYNLLWPSYQIVDFLTYADDILYANQMLDVKLTTGETTTWNRLFKWWNHNYSYPNNIAQEISDEPEAMKNLGLITSHGFMKKYDPTGVEILRQVNPDLHAWTTSYTWDPMNHEIIEDARNLIYSVGCNALIPWAIVHNKYESDKLHPPMTFRKSSNACAPFLTDNGKLTITKAYYYYKQICRVGQPHMNIAGVKTSNDSLQCIAFEKGLTCNPDAFVVINKSENPIAAEIIITGTDHKIYKAYRTSDLHYGDENYKYIGKFAEKIKKIIYLAPAKSVTTFEGI